MCFLYFLIEAYEAKWQSVLIIQSLYISTGSNSHYSFITALRTADYTNICTVMTASRTAGYQHLYSHDSLTYSRLPTYVPHIQLYL
jgi:hypothetical protein